MPGPCGFDFLDDGQTFPSQASACEAQEVLSVCALELLTLEKDEKQRTLAFLDACSRLGASLSVLRDGVRGVESRLPRQVGFFSDAEDRKKATALTCRFLGELEEMTVTLRAMDWQFLAVEEERSSRVVRIEAWRSRLLGIRGNGTEPAGEWLARLDGLVKNDARLCANARAVRQELQRFCRDTVADFCNRADRFADLSNQGERGSLASLAQLFGELRYALERLMEWIEPYGRAEKEE
ncbi:MAG: hypothetical protein IJX28_04385 [Clostridia bacterium]|nr:hypothetical protein [Clostridia bacterium]